jgi:hypothetical protein
MAALPPPNGAAGAAAAAQHAKRAVAALRTELAAALAHADSICARHGDASRPCMVRWLV